MVWSQAGDCSSGVTRSALPAVVMETPAEHSHLVSGCQEPRVVLERLFDQSTEAVKQGEQLLHVLLRVLKTTQPMLD